MAINSLMSLERWKDAAHVADDLKVAAANGRLALKALEMLQFVYTKAGDKAAAEMMRGALAKARQAAAQKPDMQRPAAPTGPSSANSSQ
jgi:hypothetical protein